MYIYFTKRVLKRIPRTLTKKPRQYPIDNYILEIKTAILYPCISIHSDIFHAWSIEQLIMVSRTLSIAIKAKAYLYAYIHLVTN